MPNTSKDVDRYIRATPEPQRAMLKQIRAAIRSAAGEAEEKLSYRMPYYHWRGRVAYFGAFRNHVSLYAMPGPALDRFAKQLEPYRVAGPRCGSRSARGSRWR